VTMPELTQFATKDPNTVSALYTGQYGEQLADVKVWMDSLLTEPDAQTYFSPLGDMLYAVNGAFNMTVNSDSYVYLDEDGWHCVRKDAFEMVYRKVTESV
jgi:trehalose-6-phosphatase